MTGAQPREQRVDVGERGRDLRFRIVGRADRHDLDPFAVVGCEPPEVWRWHDAGRTDMTVETVVRSYDDLLADALERID